MELEMGIIEMERYSIAPPGTSSGSTAPEQAE